MYHLLRIPYYIYKILEYTLRVSVLVFAILVFMTIEFFILLWVINTKDKEAYRREQKNRDAIFSELVNDILNIKEK
jgi:hypothetical protein